MPRPAVLRGGWGIFVVRPSPTLSALHVPERHSTIAASAALAGACLYLLLLRLGGSEQAAALLAMAMIAAVQLLTLWRNRHLPALLVAGELG